MSSKSNFISNKMTEFFALSSEAMANQTTHLMADIYLLSSELAGEITSDQEKRLKNNVRIANSLRKEIIDYQEICSYAITLLYQPEQITWDEINLYSLVQGAIISVEKNYSRDLSNFITIKIDDKQIIQGVYPLLFKVISHLLIWMHLLAPSLSMSIDANQVNSGVYLKLSISDLTSIQVASIEKEMCQFFKTTVEFVVSLLNGSFNWKADQLIPTEEELMIYLPQRLSE